MTTASMPPHGLRQASPRTGLAATGLVLVTAVWGSTFFMLKDVVERVPSLDFLATRFAIAALVLATVARAGLRRLTRAMYLRGAVLGAVYGSAQVFQTVGLETTPASVSGFLTGMYVVLTPVLGVLVLRSKVGPTVWLAVVVATAGLALLSLRGLAISGGAALTLFGALLYAVHILGLGRWSTERDAIALTVVQLATSSAVCAVGALPGGIALPQRAYDWSVLVYMAVVAGAGALVVQTWAQAHLAPTRAAVILTMEPVFAATFAVVLGGEAVGARLVLGGGLVLVAMYLAEAPSPGGGRTRRIDAGTRVRRR